MCDDNQRKKYDIIYKTIPNETFDLDTLTDINDLTNPKLNIKPGEYKYPIYRNLTNETKENIDYENKFISIYSNYEFRLGDKWEEEKIEMKNIVKNLSNCQTNDKIFIDV